MARIEAPNRGFSGPGAAGVVFTDGVAETDDEAALNYFRTAGFVVDGEPAEVIPVVVLDARDVEVVTVGTPLRDAAVEPEATDFLPPINAGQGDPHGPTVVAPEVHDSGPAALRPGLVAMGDPAEQSIQVSEYAEARLIEQVPAGEAVAEVVDDIDDRGPLGLSDPGSASVATPPVQADAKAIWVDYAVRRGSTREAAEAMTKTELVKHLGS